MADIKKLGEFIGAHSRVFIVSAGITAACVLLILIFSFAGSRTSKNEPNASSSQSAGIPPEEFFLPDEPLSLPGIQFSRETESSWSEAEASRWFIPLSREDLQELRASGEKSVERLLEKIP